MASRLCISGTLQPNRECVHMANACFIATWPSSSRTTESLMLDPSKNVRIFCLSRRMCPARDLRMCSQSRSSDGMVFACEWSCSTMKAMTSRGCEWDTSCSAAPTQLKQAKTVAPKSYTSAMIAYTRSHDLVHHKIQRCSRKGARTWDRQCEGRDFHVERS